VQDAERVDVAGQWLAEAHAAWPELALDEAAFVADIMSRLAPEVPIEQARAIHAADLWIATACAAGDPVALARFEERYMVTLGPILASTGLAPDEIDEVKQELRRKILVDNPLAAYPRLGGRHAT